MSGIRTANQGILPNGHLPVFQNALDASLVDQNYWGSGEDGDLIISTNTTWDSGASGDMIVKHFNNLTINAGVTLTIQARKGCLVYVKGNFVNNGFFVTYSGYECDPSAAGVPAGGIQIIRAKAGSTSSQSASVLTGCGANAIAAEAKQAAISGNGKIYTVSRSGGTGGAGLTASGNYQDGLHYNGNTGGSISNAPGGGGGGSASLFNNTVISGAGGTGTCFSGGSGGGGAAADNNGSRTGSPGSSIGGAGGAGSFGGSGAGNPGSGGGGLIIMLVRGNVSIGSGAYVTSPGRSGGIDTYACGGSSGGGMVMLLYAGGLSNSGTVSAPGGTAALATHGAPYGGAGGTGAVILEQILY